MKRLRFRRPLIEKGDRHVAAARQIVREHASVCGFLPQSCVYEYWLELNEADNAYRAGDLGLLAGRLAFLARRVAEFGDRENVRDALVKFDRLNAGGCGVA